ncbi:MAG: RNA polymerase sigma factor [Pirellulales bacterium]
MEFPPHNENEAKLVEAIAQLPEHEREAIRLRYLVKWSSKEIAIELKKSDGAIRVLLHRARSKLRLLLETMESQD